MVPVVLHDPGVSPEEHAAVEAHLATCPACRAEYGDTRRLAALIRQHADLALQDSQECPSQAVPPIIVRYGHPREDGAWQPMPVARGWEDLQRRCPGLAAACRSQERRERLERWFRRIGGLAAAACILIAIGIKSLMPRAGDAGRPGPALSSPNAPPAQPYAELITPQGNKSLALSQPVVTEDQPQEILLGGLHRVVMNRRTEATFSARAASALDGSIGGGAAVAYEIRLAEGELYVEVMSGHPFSVKTGNARLEITGTKFDVKAERDKTELVLLKGSVRFSRPDLSERFVDVTAGHVSAVVGQLPPSVPRQTDALAATAWARDLALGNALARAKPNTDSRIPDSLSGHGAQSSPPELDSLNYEQWRDAHRDWFAREFPWIFRMQETLKQKHGVDADYIELLMVSGDIWQFNYPRPADQPIPSLSRAAVSQLADHYGIEADELLEAADAGAVRRSSDQSTEQAPGGYQACLRLWQADLAAMNGRSTDACQDLLLFTLRAGTYLRNTRTAAWVWTRTHPAQAAALFQAWRQRGVSFPYSDAWSGSGPCQPWLDCLRHDAASGSLISRAAEEAITTPQGVGCQTNLASGAELAGAVAALLKPEVPQ